MENFTFSILHNFHSHHRHCDINSATIGNILLSSELLMAMRWNEEEKWNSNGEDNHNISRYNKMFHTMMGVAGKNAFWQAREKNSKFQFPKNTKFHLHSDFKDVTLCDMNQNAFNGNFDMCIKLFNLI